MSAVGKTIAWVEESPTSVEYGSVDHGRVLIHFTDGTALEVSGSSYEDVSQSVGLLTRDEVRRSARAVQGRRESDRQQRLNRAGWMAMSCEERGRQRSKRRKKLAGFALAMDEMATEMFQDMLRDANRWGHGDTPAVRKPCPTCGERECANAPIDRPASRGLTHIGGYVAMPMQGSTETTTLDALAWSNVHRKEGQE